MAEPYSGPFAFVHPEFGLITGFTDAPGIEDRYFEAMAGEDSDRYEDPATLERHLSQEMATDEIFEGFEAGVHLEDLADDGTIYFLREPDDDDDDEEDTPPECDVCGSITIRVGDCYKCLNCGNSMGVG